ncbi:carbon-nitrogen family protein [Stylonychia lemnae]|uniref:Carbon-nitrogen family protein n=1 Tax=Stylonychia lemnae TaxID=5949 RepID=A0A078AT15_STYLE|nr:carbon-nitrogen family protein [Stylonychia lemnae]|eukprot:CDW84003.1 carbon-nitrogen family protein [Stylonychia lemnae]
METSNLKIIALQYAPVLKNVKASMEIVNNLINQYSEKDQIDVLLLPELSFVGSSFYGYYDILPFAEQQGNGKSYHWCVEVSKKLKCIVIIGYPEICGDILYNSMLVVSESGQILKNYRKRQLFSLEWDWALPGNEFAYLDAKVWRIHKTVRFGLGICNDIWYNTPQQQYQMDWARFLDENDCQVILMHSNWPDYKLYENNDIKTQVMMIYWLNRLVPVTQSSKKSKNIYFINANRIGEELGTEYIGSSCFFTLQPQITIENNLECNNQGSLICKLQI